MRGSKSSDIILGYVIPMFIVFVLVIVILLMLPTLEPGGSN